MPQVNAAAALQICLLLSALPAQYLISRWTETTASQRLDSTRRLVNSWNNFCKSYLSLESWIDWAYHWISKARPWFDESYDPQGESPALEVLEYKAKRGYFGESTELRSPRPRSVKFHVGQVFLHKRYGYVGVIVGWDAKAKAPEEWLQKMYKENKKSMQDTPHYKVLIDTSSTESTPTAYIPQQDIEILSGIQI
ncbi:uncharacterized protein LOC122803960 isoform X2 [Protopterus annectens]|uniref:uncharacterized protein LOC122803960 isoform X2 n=1 Tax=Protopterus annectens TaxID=7888 RepID=UPI001CFB7D0B|nr:uncharacterized protein LOC122803960 isoform X2 [Protopterus annectens]